MRLFYCFFYLFYFKK